MRFDVDAYAENYFAYKDPQFENESEAEKEMITQEIISEIPEVEPFEDPADYEYYLKKLHRLKQKAEKYGIDTDEVGLTEFKDAINQAYIKFVEDDEREYDDEPEDDYDEEEYIPSATHGDYSPSAPWLAPGMSPRDFF